MELTANHFGSFFKGIYGYPPFPWQQRLVDRLAAEDEWPEVLDLPTGTGKTAALDAAVFHLALRTDELSRAAVRISLVVDRRLVVDDAYERAQGIAKKLADPDTIAEARQRNAVVEVASRLNKLAEPNQCPLVVQRLRGGAPLEHEWVRTPTQPTILCSTVDQVGSRLLFRGYGVGDRMRPIHAGLLGQHSLILLDEAHLSQPFQDTVEAIREFGRADVRIVLLTATLGTKARRSLTLSEEDCGRDTLRQRLNAPKPALLTALRSNEDAADAFSRTAIAMMEKLKSSDVRAPAVAVVVNRVLLARKVHSALQTEGSELLLLIGRCRPVDRDGLVRKMTRLKTGLRDKANDTPLFIIATQCLEVGVDLDLDGLVTQAAPMDALRQRFGRLNRSGRSIEAQAEIIALPTDLSKQKNDPVYGDHIRQSWDILKQIAENAIVDFGIESLNAKLRAIDMDTQAVSAPRPESPIAMPAYFDLWSQTSPVPTTDPEISLFLHGKDAVSPDVSVIWRDDIENISDDGFVELMALMPPRTREGLQLPIWTAQRLLNKRRLHTDDMDIGDLSTRPSDATQPNLQPKNSCVFRWAGADDPRTGRLTGLDEIRPGDLVLLPASYGGCDKLGWHPDSEAPVEDIADKAAEPYRQALHTVRISRSVTKSDADWRRLASVLPADEEVVRGNDLDDLIDHVLAKLPSGGEPALDSVVSADFPLRSIREPMDALRRAKQGRVRIHRPYGPELEDGVVLVAEKGLKEESSESTPVSIPATEDERLSNGAANPMSLNEHSREVEVQARSFAHALGLPIDIQSDLALAGYLHDAGKADRRFQTMLSGGNAWSIRHDRPLAKSAAWSKNAWLQARLPKGWRHEALSVQMALAHPRFSEAKDPHLVLWLIGTHHGFGRPFYHFVESGNGREIPLPCLEVASWPTLSKAGPQSLAFSFQSLDWAAMFEFLKRKYGIWGLAHLEAVVRLADHRASEAGATP